MTHLYPYVYFHFFYTKNVQCIRLSILVSSTSVLQPAGLICTSTVQLHQLPSELVFFISHLIRLCLIQVCPLQNVMVQKAVPLRD
jgi:hypothetical protein